MSKSIKSTSEESVFSVPGHTRQRGKSRRWMWIVLGVLILLGALGALG